MLQKAPEQLDCKSEEKIYGKGLKFERIRRITGYIVGTIDSFNNGKKAEVVDWVWHNPR